MGLPASAYASLGLGVQQTVHALAAVAPYVIVTDVERILAKVQNGQRDVTNEEVLETPVSQLGWCSQTEHALTSVSFFRGE
eukprot:1444797-Amphidinium_carterae.1